MIEHATDRTRAYLVGIGGSEESPAESGALLAELASLAATLDLDVVGSETIRIREISPRYYLGAGKAEEVRQRVSDLEAEVVVFDVELSPSQQRNWEKLAGCSVTDRQGVILEIFGERAQTREANLQVELALMEYQLPRLTSAWVHLSRQRGGRRGTRGEGETQLEIDRRIVLKRIATVKRELSAVRGSRATMRRQRAAVPLPTGSIVGYTNAGKSSLLQALTGSYVLVADKLFATLDPATRRLELAGGQEVLLTDTVGFIRRLPHGLIEAFKSTLEETLLATFLVHVIDASDPRAVSHARVTDDVLAEIGSREKPTILVLNKIDRAAPEAVTGLRSEFRDAVALSALTGEGLMELRDRVREVVSASFHRIRVELPLGRSDLAALIHRTGRVIEERYLDHGIAIRADVPRRTRELVKEWNSGE